MGYFQILIPSWPSAQRLFSYISSQRNKWLVFLSYLCQILSDIWQFCFTLGNKMGIRQKVDNNSSVSAVWLYSFSKHNKVSIEHFTQPQQQQLEVNKHKGKRFGQMENKTLKGGNECE